MGSERPRPPKRTARLYQHVAEALIRAIAAGTYKPGMRLPAERDLATEFDVSRPTIREAIIALEVDGLVEVRQASGVYVLAAARHTPQPHDVGAIELTEARLVIECEIAALAAAHATPDDLRALDALLVEMEAENQRGPHAGEIVDRHFHETVARASGNGALVRVVEDLWHTRNRSPQCIRFFEKSRGKGNRPDVGEHRAILLALRARDPEAARSAMRDHLMRVLSTLLDATEIEAVEEARKRVAVQRGRFTRA